MHEICGCQATSKDDPGRFQSAEISGINIFSDGGTGLFVGERAFFEGTAEGALTVEKMSGSVIFDIFQKNKKFM